MTQYAGTPKLATTLPVPDANTPFNSSAVNAPIKAEWDSILGLKQYGFYAETLNTIKPPYPLAGNHVNSGVYRLTGQIKFTSTGNPLELTSARTYARVAHVNATVKTDAVGNYWQNGLTFAPPEGYYVQKGSSGGPSSDAGIIFDVDLPSNCTVTRAYVKFKPMTGHGALPSKQPFLYVYLVDSTNGTTTLVDSVQNADAAVGTYEGSIRTISCSFSQPFDAGRCRIFLQVFGEHGTDTIDELQMYLPVVEFTRSQIGEELGEPIP